MPEKHIVECNDVVLLPGKDDFMLIIGGADRRQLIDRDRATITETRMTWKIVVRAKAT